MTLPALAACGSDERVFDALPPSQGVIRALDHRALQVGNRALGCADADVEGRVDAWLSNMTLEQKLFEMHGLQLLPINELYPAGGDETLGIPAFQMVDGPRGVRAGRATAFPVGMARGATWDPELERRVGLAIGLETLAKGGNVLLAPTINLLRHPGWGRAQESYSEDPFHMAEMAVGFIGGAQNHVLASAKHFAVNSIENTRFEVSANLDQRTLREVYLPHFRRAVEEARVASVMSAYNRVNGVYCGEHPELLSKILKGEWGFRGFVESDWILGTRSTVPSALAGLDIEMPFANHYGAPLVDAVSTGSVSRAVIDAAVRRILRQKACFELASRTGDPAVVESTEHRALSREVAEKAIVLLKNERGTLPLSARELGNVVMVGALGAEANLGDRGSSSVTPSSAVSPLQGLSAFAPGGQLAAIPSDNPSDAELAVVVGKTAVVVAGLTYLNEGEFIPIAQEMGGLSRGGDRASLDLSEPHRALIERVAARAARTIVVLEGGSAITVQPWVERVDALLMAWYPGMEGGNALARILVGEVNPSGKLPVTFPRTMADLPLWDIESKEVDYGYFHGYRLLDRNSQAPEYPFGFGMSYTEFALGRLRLERDLFAPDELLKLSVDVQNKGNRAGDEVVQAYIGYSGSSVERPEHELKAFRRVSLDPGEVKTVELEIPVSELSYYDVALGRFVVEATTYEVKVGVSSRELPLGRSFRVR